MKLEKIRLGEALIKEGLINAAQLETVLSLQQGTSRRLGKLLVEQKYVTEEEISLAISRQLKIEFINLKSYEIKKEWVSKLTEIQARKYRAIVINKDSNTNTYLVGMADPSDLAAFDEIEKILKSELNIVCVTETDLLESIDKYYSNKEMLSNLAKELEQDVTSISVLDNQELSLEDAPVIKLLQSLFEDALKNKVSDIHIEPQKNDVLIRFRIDGELREHTKVSLKICAPLISRLKIISNLNISEKRLPQDGRFNIKVLNQAIDVRISIIPQVFGEAAVMRLLIHNEELLNLENLNMPKQIYNSIYNICNSPEGMLLVVGPTGSGKTTTLYSAISSVNDISKKIITIEDPVEYQLPLINQIQVNDKIGFSFESILRTVLRQDPDIILIGEIRDNITAQIALRGAITGHLIFSTLHTKDTLSVPLRLIDMGAPNYMVATALQGVLSQRLLRANCTHCNEIDKIDNLKDKLWLKERFGDNFEENKLYKSRGCKMCNYSGVLGRTPIYEFLQMNNDLAQSLYANDVNAFSKKAEKYIAGNRFIDNIKNLLLNGVISIAEARKSGY